MLQVTGPEIDRLERLAGSVLLSGVKSILCLQPPALCFRTLSDQVVVDLATAFIDPRCDDMEMLTLDVVVLVYDVWLIPESKTFEIILSHLYQLLIRQMIVLVGIKRYMEDGIFRL